MAPLDNDGGGEPPAFAGIKNENVVSVGVADPPEDDLDDLDDLLDEFSAVKSNIANSKNDFSTPTNSSATENTSSVPSVQDFEKEMAALIGSLGYSADIDTPLEEFAQRSNPSAARPPLEAAAQARNREEDFQDSVRKTMERLQATSNQQQTAGARDASGDLLEQLFKEMQNGETISGSDENLNSMLLGMMEQLTNKDILYEPMKELHEKFPAWLKSNHERLGTSDNERFERQNYSDSNTDDRDFIVDRMQKMQEAGSPPADLVGDLEASEALGDMDGMCTQQ